MSNHGTSLQTQSIEDRIASRIDTDVTGALAVSDEAGGLAFVNVGQVMEFAKMMSIAQIGVRRHLRGNPGACLAVCVQAIEWRMSPFAVANKSYLVNDQIAYEAQLIHAVAITRAPIKGRLKHEYTGEGEKRRLRVWAELRDEPGEIVEYTTPLFKDITPKNSPLWKSDPEQQLHYFATRSWCRRHFPDVLLGVYAPDELDGAPQRGPDRARDVTPLAERLAAGNRAETGFNHSFVQSETAGLAPGEFTDPETGEITNPDTPQQPTPPFDQAAVDGDRNDGSQAQAAPDSSTSQSGAADSDDTDFPGDKPAKGKRDLRKLMAEDDGGEQ